MRVAKPIVLEEASRRDLECNSGGRSIASRVVMRSRIVLLAARGLQNLEIAEQMQIAPRTVNRLRQRFLKLGMPGLLTDAPRLGRTPSIPAAVVAQVIEKTTQSSPSNATHWSRSTMAREMGISQHKVIGQVRKTLRLDGYAQLFHVREVRRSQPTRRMLLRKEHLSGRTLGCTPHLYAPLQCAHLPVLKAAGVLSLQELKDRLGLKPGVVFK